MEEEYNSFEDEIKVCLHRVSFSYWDFKAEVTDELIEYLTEEAESRAKECIMSGCRSGDLNCLYETDDEEQEEICGWWEIRD